jgi:hypothetical protein
MTQRAAYSPATCAAGRIRLAHGLIKTIGSLRYRPAALDQPPILRRDGGRRRVRLRDVRGHVTRAGHTHVVYGRAKRTRAPTWEFPAQVSHLRDPFFADLTGSSYLGNLLITYIMSGNSYPSVLQHISLFRPKASPVTWL